MPTNWYNSDGLYIKFGTNEGQTGLGGELEDGDYGVPHFVEFTVSLASTAGQLAAFGTDTILSYTCVIPNGARVTKSEIYVETAATSGGSAVLNYGLMRTDTTTAYDIDGFDASVAVASLTAGATIAGDGALINTTLANDGLFSATVGTANFTAGKVKLRIFWYMP